MLMQSGYNAKVGYTSNIVFLLLPTQQQLFSIPYFTMAGGQRFYLVEKPKLPQDGALMCYEANHPLATKIMNFSVSEDMQLTNEKGRRSLSFSFAEKNYNLSFEYKKSNIKYYEYYPQVVMDDYFHAAVSDVARQSLLSTLKPLIAGKSEYEAVSLLLNFVQTAFEYQTDDEQFGREKPFFVEETLHYPYADCEDRSVFFSFLVRELLGLRVVGLDYPGHIATAVSFSQDVRGDYLMHDGKKYVVCDPTYINAPVGLSMPQFKDVTAKIIP
jgi:hypothetical protein